MSTRLTAKATYQVTGLWAEGFSCLIGVVGTVDWSARSSNHILALVTVLDRYENENHTYIDPYEGFDYTLSVVQDSLGAVVSCVGPNHIEMTFSPLNLTESSGFRFFQDNPGEPSMYFVHDVNASVGDVVQIWTGVSGWVVSREDRDTPVGVLPVLHINWSRTWIDYIYLVNSSQTLQLTYDQRTGFLISAAISGHTEWDVNEIVWNQTGSIESTNMHLPRLGFPSPLFVLVICVMIVLPVIFLVLALYIHRRYLR